MSDTASIPFRPISVFDGANAEPHAGRQLGLVKEAAQDFRRWFRETGTPEYVGTFDLAAVPYPARFGLLHAGRVPAPFVTMMNRLVVVRWQDPNGSTRTLLWEPSDVELGRNCPFYANLSRKVPSFLEPLGFKRYRSVLEHLQSLGVAPEEVDYLSFDHLHIQDVRRLVGTRGPAEDLGEDRWVEPWFPNAKLVVQRKELELLDAVHPLQRVWYQPETYRDLRPEALLSIEGDVLLGPGVALLHTPGHTPGNHSLVLHTDTGIWASSENVIAAECLTPEHSRIRGLREWAKEMRQEVILNGNTIETTAEQYNSVIKEKHIVDRSATNPEFLQFQPSAELWPNPVNVGAQPTFTHGGIRHGHLRRTRPLHAAAP
ncbi:MAG: hypothetical protein ACOC97_02315 [Myxococcota bacterium]